MPLLALIGCAAPISGAERPPACTITNAALADVRAPFDLAMERGGEAVLIRFDPGGTAPTYLLLRMPGCTLVPLAGGAVPPGRQPPAVRPGGARLIVAARYPDGKPEWWFSPAPAIPLVQVDAPAEARVAGQPVLSEDGAWAAWVDQVPGSGEQRWHARPLPAGAARDGALTALGVGSYEMLGFDAQGGAMTLARNLAEIVDVDTITGRIVGAPLRPGAGTSSQPHTFRRLQNGWFAWDAYREDTPWRAVWSIGGTVGRYDVDWGKMIVHASVNPTGTYAALSLESRFNRIVASSDTLAVVRLADGKEIFRKKLPRFTRTPVAFLGEQFLAWTEGNQVLVSSIP